jgi:two-component system sensor histidine kinase PhoQ
MNSISVRLLLAAALVMSVFIGLTTLAIQHTVDQRAETASFERLQGQIYALLGSTDISTTGAITVDNADMPNPRMRQPMSGHYAEVRDENMSQVWRSPSLTSSLPSSDEGAIGQWIFTKEDHSQLGPLFILRFAVEWLLPEGDIAAYQFVVGDSREEFNRQQTAFNRNLWISMLTMGALLLMCIALILAWGLNPIRRISRQLNQVENGTRDSLPDNVPAELHPLTSRINALIASERGRQKRYRHTLDDLAHSLKTPLSVLRNIGSETDEEITRQATRMEQIIGYHIKRADAGNRRLLTPPMPVAPTAERIIRTLKKVYRDSTISFKNNIKTTDQLRIEEADLMELLGNLLENSCKYGATSIELSFLDDSDARALRKGKAKKRLMPRRKKMSKAAKDDADSAWVHLIVDDNGQGFPPDQIDSLIDRGVRADTRREGQGIGLAISNELVENYGGTITLGESPSGGARVCISMPAID